MLGLGCGVVIGVRIWINGLDNCCVVMVNWGLIINIIFCVWKYKKNILNMEYG